VASAVVGYVLTLRQVSVVVTTANGVETQLFPANETFTWSALIVGGMALTGIAIVLSIRTKRLRETVQAGSEGGRSSLTASVSDEASAPVV